MVGRTFAIGDIHGCADALDAILNAIQPDPTDTIVALGDYIDRGPDSAHVIDQLIALGGRCQLIPLMGNHEEMLLDAIRDKARIRPWLECGGMDALRSYGWMPGGPRRPLANWFPRAHREFIAGCRAYHENDTHIFLHAGYIPELPLIQQPAAALRWRVTDAAVAVPHCSGKVVVVGHTPQFSGEVLDLGFLVCIDTNCARGGWLTALDVDTNEVLQVDRHGARRR